MISFTFVIAEGVNTTGAVEAAGAFTTSTFGVVVAVAIKSVSFDRCPFLGLSRSYFQ
jgi:hypothetical protein